MDTRHSSSDPRHSLLHAGGLLLLLLLAYLPASRAGFIWDDDAYVTDNPLLTAPDGLKRIWFSGEHPSQYFPLVYTTLRLEYALWGLDPQGYHVVNILLHYLNALLVWTMLRRLAVPGAWLAAALFALHPVQVETVAWITELKNTQSTFFYLLSLLCWMRFAEGTVRPVGQVRQVGLVGQRWTIYALSLLLYGMALLSKTTACTLPAAMLLVRWLRPGPPKAKDGAPTGRTLLLIAPFLLLGLGMGWFSVAWERHMGHYGKEFGLSFNAWERLLIAGRAIWFYLAKLFWPATLTFSYPRWRINWHDLAQYGWPAAALLGALVLWICRRAVWCPPFRVSGFSSRGAEARALKDGHPAWRGAIIAAVFYAATLAPMLGLVQNFTFRYSFVADHYQYLACIGPLALVAAGLSRLGQTRQTRPTSPTPRSVFCCGLLLLLALLTWRQCGVYRDPETLWRDTLAKNPGSWLAYSNLGLIHYQRGELKAAEDCFNRAIDLNPQCFEALGDLGLVHAAEGKFAEAEQNYQQALQINPNDAGAHGDLGLTLASRGHLEQALAEFAKASQLAPGSIQMRLSFALALQRAGRGKDAAAQYEQALALAPHHPDALNNLAWILATDPDDSLRNGSRAVVLAEQAWRLSGNRDPITAATLAAAYAETGRFPEAVGLARQAQELASKEGDSKLAGKYHALEEVFLFGRPFRETRSTNSAAPPAR